MLGIVIAAGGAGVRFGGEKILAPVNGRPLLLHTVERLAAVEEGAAMVLVLPPERRTAIRAELGDRLAALGLTRFADGGVTRQESVESGLRALPEEADPVLVHDAVRPCFSLAAARVAVERAAAEGAAILAVPARDTLKRAGADGRIEGTIDRSVVWLAETPQVFARELLAAAFAGAAEAGFAGTDEASLVEHLGHPVAIVPGEPWNVKVTEARDVEVVEALLGGPR